MYIDYARNDVHQFASFSRKEAEDKRGKVKLAGYHDCIVYLIRYFSRRGIWKFPGRSSEIRPAN